GNGAAVAQRDQHANIGAPVARRAIWGSRNHDATPCRAATVRDPNTRGAPLDSHGNSATDAEDDRRLVRTSARVRDRRTAVLGHISLLSDLETAWRTSPSRSRKSLAAEG